MKATTERGRDARGRGNMHVTNVGGSLTTAVCLSLIAWSVRVLRSAKHKDRKQRTTSSSQPTVKLNRQTYGVLSAKAFWMLVRTKPVPYLLLDVRPATDSSSGVVSQLSERLSVLHVLPEELANLLRNRNTLWAKKFPDVPVPSLKTTLIFISTHGHSSSHAAALGTSLGFMRCSIVDGGLAAAVPLAHFDTPDASSPEKSISLSFDAVLLLLETVRDNGNALGLVILDIRRFDERALYGKLEGSVHITMDHLPKALGMSDEDWLRSFRFHKPSSDNLILLHSRSHEAAAWAKQLLSDAGSHNCHCYVDGAYAGPDGTVRNYEAYGETEAPPEPVAMGQTVTFDRTSAERELLDRRIAIHVE